VLARLAAAGSPEAMLLMLERLDPWRAVLGQVGPLMMPIAAGIEVAIERHRAACLAEVSGLFPEPARTLVEALVMPLDLERVLEVLRRRRVGETAEAVDAAVSRGALLGDAALGAIARAGDLRAVARLLARFGLLSAEEAAALGAGSSNGTDPVRLEAEVIAAFEHARRRRAGTRGVRGNGAAISAILDAERAEASAVVAELRASGPDAATDLEREVRLTRLDGLAARGRRDPLGIGVAIGYIAAVEAEAIRLRVALASVASGWSRDRAGAWLELGARAA
jgi:vacuolar-type H+-ATPase subunit C/Vma6